MILYRMKNIYILTLILFFISCGEGMKTFKVEKELSLYDKREKQTINKTFKVKVDIKYIEDKLHYKYVERIGDGGWDYEYYIDYFDNDGFKLFSTRIFWSTFIDKDGQGTKSISKKKYKSIKSIDIRSGRRI